MQVIKKKKTAYNVCFLGNIEDCHKVAVINEITFIYHIVIFSIAAIALKWMFHMTISIKAVYMYSTLLQDTYFSVCIFNGRNYVFVTGIEGLPDSGRHICQPLKKYLLALYLTHICFMEMISSYAVHSYRLLAIRLVAFLTVLGKTSESYRCKYLACNIWYHLKYSNSMQ